MHHHYHYYHRHRRCEAVRLHQRYRRLLFTYFITDSFVLREWLYRRSFIRTYLNTVTERTAVIREHTQTIQSASRNGWGSQWQIARQRRRREASFLRTLVNSVDELQVGKSMGGREKACCYRWHVFVESICYLYPSIEQISQLTLCFSLVWCAAGEHK